MYYCEFHIILVMGVILLQVVKLQNQHFCLMVTLVTTRIAISTGGCNCMYLYRLLWMLANEFVYIPSASLTSTKLTNQDQDIYQMLHGRQMHYRL